MAEDHGAPLGRMTGEELEPGPIRHARRRPIGGGTRAVLGAIADRQREAACVLGGVAAQRSIEVARERAALGAGARPRRVQARVHQDHVAPLAHHRSRREPSEQRRSIRRGEHVVEGVARAAGPLARGHAQQVGVVIPEHTARVHARQEPQHSQRVGAAIHEVADGVELVDARLERRELEQALELVAATLDVADEDASLQFVYLSDNASCARSSKLICLARSASDES